MGAPEERGIRRVPIHRALSKPNLVYGCDREMMQIAGLISATLVFFMWDLKAAIVGIGLWFFSVFALRAMAKADPYMRRVYVRNFSYQHYYAPRPTPSRVINKDAQKRRMGAPWKR